MKLVTLKERSSVDEKYLKLKSLFRQGRKNLADEHDAGEVKHSGNHRGGDAAIITDRGEVYGKCPRKTLLRRAGFQGTIEDNRILMFEGGYASEDTVMKVLGATDATVEGNDESLAAPIGEYVAEGRPDVLFPLDRTVVELKRCSSIWTAKGVHFELEPKSDHLIQTAFYMLLTGYDGFLMYRSDVDWHLSTAPRWLQDKFQYPCYDVEFKPATKSGGIPQPLKILPFERIYQLDFDDKGMLVYNTEGLDNPVTTVFHRSALERAMSTIYGKKSYKLCDYCELADTCDQHEQDSEMWWDQSISHPDMRKVKK
jgi:hypothetical protein